MTALIFNDDEDVVITSAWTVASRRGGTLTICYNTIDLYRNTVNLRITREEFMALLLRPEPYIDLRLWQ